MDKLMFTEQVLAAEKQLYGTAKSILSNDADCADAIQSAILAAYTKLHTLRNEAFFRTWLTRILINECYQIRRRQMREIPDDPQDTMYENAYREEEFVTYGFGGMTVQEMAEDMDGGLYVLLQQSIPQGEDILHRYKLLHLDRDGKAVFEEAPEWLLGGNIAVDQNGNLYVVVHDMVYILDGQGQEVRHIQLPDQYSMINQHELCRGKDGAVYLATLETRPNIYDPAELEEYLKTHPKNTILIRFDPNSQAGYEEVAEHVIPEQVLKLGNMARGGKTDFVFWSVEGVYTYSLGDEQAVRIMQMYEAPLQWEGAYFFALPDGRLVFAKSFDDVAVDENGLDFRSVPEALRFFYIMPE